MLMPRFWLGFKKMPWRAGAIYLAIGLVVATHWVTFYASIKLSNASVAATCMAFTSFFIAFFEPVLMRRAFDIRELFFGLAVIPGVALVVGGTPAGMRTGLAVGALSAFLAAMFGILNKRFIEHGEALTVTGLEMAAGAAFLTVLGWIRPASSIFVLPGRNDAGLLLVLALGCTLAPFVLSLVALRYLTAFTQALALNMEPVYAIVLAIAIFGEQQQLQAGFYAGWRLSSLLFSATRCFLQQVQVPLRHRTWPAIWTDNHMDRASFCQDHVATLDAIREFHNTALRASEFGLDEEFVFVSGG